ncbi:MAG: DUF393 domain-containing protein [Bacteroidetes bacterium]|nr:DUF393 domain-containing protein [Bacteroidota bacterium]
MKDTYPIIFFDGECKFCNSSVNFIIKRDKKKYFKFAPLQGKTALDYGFQNNDKIPDSIILIQNQKIYKYSDAALKIALKLDGLWKILYVFIIIPPVFRDWVYKFVASNRYKWFGKYQHCMIPDKNLIERFLE